MNDNLQEFIKLLLHPKLLKVTDLLRVSDLTEVKDPLLKAYGLELWIKRDDQIHSIVSGNKWRKLKYNLDHALFQNSDCIISMGGPFSNFLHALAFVGYVLDLQTIGLIRGEKPRILSPTLQDMIGFGMQVDYINRSEYRQLRSFKNWEDQPLDRYTGYWITEGGFSDHALTGVAEIVSEITMPFDHFCCPCGTGATLAGLVSALHNKCTMTGFVVLNNASYLKSEIETLLSQLQVPPKSTSWTLNFEYAFGGFAKMTQELLHFIDQFRKTSGIVLEPVYTGKMMFGIYDLIKQGHFKRGERIIALHTGGLQGLRGFTNKVKNG